MSWKKFVVCSDVHGDMQDAGAVSAFFKFLNIWKPEIKIFAGDLWDFRPLRRKADEHEKRESLRKDFDAGMSFLKKFRPQVFLRGNHDERMWDLRDTASGVVQDFAETNTRVIEKECDKLKCQLIPYCKRKGVYPIGSDLFVSHGFFGGATAAKRMAQEYGESMLVGHGHSIDHVTVGGLKRRFGRMIGCLCRLDHVYNRAHVSSLRHGHGWAYGIVHTSGASRVWQAEEVGGKWILPTRVVEL